MPPEGLPIEKSAVSTTWSRHRLVRVVVICGAVSSLISAVVLYANFRNQGAHLGLSAGNIVLVSNTPELFQAEMIDVTTKKSTPIVVDGVGFSIVTDVVHSDTHNYYIVSNNAGTESNVYTSDNNNKQKGLAQKTSSKSSKYGLSYDEQSDTIAYTSKKAGEDPYITLLIQGTTTEKRIANGENPTLLKGGFFIVYERNGELHTYNISSGKEYALLTIPKDGSYAVDGSGLQAVIFEPQSMTYSYYSLMGMLAASVTRIEKVTGPRGNRKLSLTGETLISAFATDSGVVLSRSSGVKQVVISGSPFTNTRIKFIYE